MTPPLPKVPRTPPEPLTLLTHDILEFHQPLWRIHRTVGGHALPWDMLRTAGPLASMRWDPQPPHQDDHPGNGVMYAAVDLPTVLAEVFQLTRTISLSGSAAHATSWTPVRPLRLLDLAGEWPIRNKASHALSSAPKPTCRNWARAVHDTWPDLDGLVFPSTMTGQECVVLFEAAGTTFPAAPDFSRPLTSPLLAHVIADIAENDIGYAVDP